MSLKISRIALSLTEKLSILHKYDSNPSLEKTKLAESLNISESTLRTIIVKRKEIQKCAIEGSNKRKKIKNGKYFTLEQILIQWINKMNDNSMPLNGPIIQRRALKIAKSLKITDFNATNGCSELLKVLICANSDGTEKFNPLVIGKPLKPKSFIDNKSFPCEYSVKKTTSLTNEDFCFWVKKLDKNMIKNNRKILLIVDNYSSTIPKDIALKNVELVFFPPYITKNLQPLNVGVINVFKQYYEKHYLNVLKNSNTKQLNIILNALRHITAAWSSIQPQVIAECFKKAGIECFSNKVIDDDTASEAMVSIKNKSTHLKKASRDKNLMITEHKYVQNSEDLIDIAEDNNSDEDSDSGQNESLYDTINAIKIIRRYLPTLKGKYQYELHSGQLQYIARCSTTGWISFHT
ncbi:tigger transposable element-derived protein 6-like [Metopolophium dirhodum]|uniref:tigger transposable element-derived protein 6-like n=1 Tax=Metopolophium dirhodum TaxID=44670 RepID=UPI002990751E|nr:tigger transposable element-derived protein 6-like [Metopolophium dirhodum]